VIFGNGLTSIGDYAFCSSGISSIVIPDSVVTIGSAPFHSCENLTSVTLGSGLTSIGDLAFCSSAISSIVIPDSVVTIGESAFINCKSLTSVTLGNGLTSIGDYAFYSSVVSSIVIPDSVETIGTYAFAATNSSLHSVQFSALSLSIVMKEASFCPAQLKSVVLPHTANVESGAFCSNVTIEYFPVVN